jgi:hypothetical protein
MSAKENVNFCLKLCQIFATLFVGLGAVLFSELTAYSSCSTDIAKFLLELNKTKDTLQEFYTIGKTSASFCNSIMNLFPFISGMFIFSFILTFFVLILTFIFYVKSKSKII